MSSSFFIFFLSYNFFFLMLKRRFTCFHEFKSMFPVTTLMGFSFNFSSKNIISFFFVYER